MNRFSKLAVTAGVVGAVGAAGSFGTYAAFTSTPAAQSVDLTNAALSVTATPLTITDADKFRTHEGSNAHTGQVTIKNEGNVPVNPYVDFDGLVGVISNARGYESSEDDLAESLQVDTSYRSDFGGKAFGGAAAEGGDPVVAQQPDFLDQATRLWKVNRRGYIALPADPGAGNSLTADKLVLAPNESKVLYIRLKLRETPGETDAQNNEMQGDTTALKLNVAGVEEGAEPDASVVNTAQDNGN